MADPALAPSPPDQQIAPEAAAAPGELSPEVEDHHAEASPAERASRMQDLVSAFDDAPEPESGLLSTASEEGLAPSEPRPSADEAEADPQSVLDVRG